MKSLAALCLLLMCVLADALTTTEIAKFSNTAGAKHVSVTVNTNTLTIKSTGWPDHTTQKVNPNDNKEQGHEYTVNKNPPVPSSSAVGKCLPMSTIGIAINGVPYYSPYTAEGTNAGVCEKFDTCDGHADPRGAYHYHIGAKCVVNSKKGEFVGVAMDGHPIYSAPDGFDKSKLDTCHGEKFTDGGVERYRYILSGDFPYILGCFKGEVVDTNVKNMMNGRDCKFPKDIKSQTTCAASEVGILSITMVLGNLLVLVLARLFH